MRSLQRESKSVEVLRDGGVEPCAFRLMLAQICDEALHLVGERLAVVLRRRSADVAARRQHMLVPSNLLERDAPAETRLVFVSVRLTAPTVVRVGDPGDVVASQLPVGAINHSTKFAGIDEQDFATPVPQPAAAVFQRGVLPRAPRLRSPVAGEKPEACRDLRGVEELTRQGDHAVN